MRRAWTNPEYRENVVSKLRGRTFLSRGGNSRLTEPQLRLAFELDLPVEFAIETASVRGQFPSLPNCYKVDLADPTCQLAIEVDGNSHRSKRWQFLDRRKTEVLAALGWRVIRFRNEEVLKDLDRVVGEIERARGRA
jgi:hypothetical protein